MPGGESDSYLFISCSLGSPLIPISCSIVLDVASVSSVLSSYCIVYFVLWSNIVLSLFDGSTLPMVNCVPASFSLLSSVLDFRTYCPLRFDFVSSGASTELICLWSKLACCSFRSSIVLIRDFMLASFCLVFLRSFFSLPLRCSSMFRLSMTRFDVSFVDD